MTAFNADRTVREMRRLAGQDGWTAADMARLAELFLDLDRALSEGGAPLPTDWRQVRDWPATSPRRPRGRK